MNTKEKIKNELVELIKQANELLGKFKDQKQKPPLHLEYQGWYSKALKAMEWLAPDRYEEFRRYYEPEPKRKDLGYGTYVIQDFFKGVAPGGYYHKDFDCRGQAAVGFYNQFAILVSLMGRIDSVLADIQGGLYAELQDDEIEIAVSLAKTNARAAGALAGVVLEGHLQKVAVKHGVKIAKKSPTLGDLNDPLKSAGIYDTAAWRKILYLADLRNLCSHKKAVDPTVEQVTELIDGVRWAVKNVA